MIQKRVSTQLELPNLPRLNFEEFSAEEVLALDKEAIQNIPTETRKNLSLKFFYEVSENGAALDKYLPLLQRCSLTEILEAPLKRNKRNFSPENESELNTICQAKLFLRDIALKIHEKPELIAGCPNLDQETKEDILNTTERYITPRQAIVVLNEPLIGDYFNKHHFFGKTELDDLKQIASIGLMEAVDRFIPELGNSFSTYAFYCISSKVNNANSYVGMFSVSYSTRENLFNLLERENQERLAHGSSNFANLASEYGFRYRSALHLANAFPIVYNPKIHDMQNSDRSCLDTPQEILITEEIQENKKAVMTKFLTFLKETLNERELRVISLYYGLEKLNKRALGPMSLEEIGKIVSPKGSITKQAVGTLIKKALNKIREKADPELLPEIDKIS